MTRAAVLLLALGCGTGAAPAEPPLPPVRATAAPAGKTAVSPLSYLGDEFERVFPERVRLARYGAVRLAAGDPQPAIAGPSEGEAIMLGQSPSLVVVDSVSGRLRVVVEEGEYRLLVWIEATDVNWVIGETTDLAFEPGEPAAAPPAAGVRVRPGLPVARRDQRGSLVFVSHEDTCLSVAGWVPVDRVVRAYTPVDEPELERELSVGPGTALYERPNGRELARFTSECRVAASGREEAGHTLVVYEGNGFEARGWIAAASPTTGAMGALFGFGSGGFGGFGAGGERVLIPAGSCLYAARGGPVVGVATDDTEQGSAESAEGGWHAIAVATGWGELPLWVAEDGRAAAQPVAEETEEAGLLGVRKVRQLRLTRCR
jgi:hypothetical protein